MIPFERSVIFLVDGLKRLLNRPLWMTSVYDLRADTMSAA